jgi:hypothetical protein
MAWNPGLLKIVEICFGVLQMKKNVVSKKICSGGLIVVKNIEYEFLHINYKIGFLPRCPPNF